MLFLLFLFVFPKAFRKPKTPSRKPKIPSGKPKKTKTTFGKTKQTKCLKVSCPPLVLFGFPEGFLQNQQNIRENHKYLRETKENKKNPSGKPNKTKCLKVSYPPLDMGFVVLLFLFFGFPEGFYKTKKPSRQPKIPSGRKQKNRRENKKQQSV